MKTIIKNANVLLESGLANVDVLFDEEAILEIKGSIDQEADQVIDATGLTLLPGLVDVHVHLREPGPVHKETIKTGTQAAAKGGFTTIFAMPNVKPFPDNVETMKDYMALIEKDSCVHTHPYATITCQEAGKQVVDMQALNELGIHWFSDDGVGVASDEVMLEAMQKAKATSSMIVAHTEDMNYRKPLACVHDSQVMRDQGYIGIPSACESAQLIRDLEIAKKVGNAYHACHISAKESVAALANAKANKANVTAEVTAHHLLLEDVDVKGTNWKMNPPLRSYDDRMALISGLESGALDFIANDHAPHTMEEKAGPMEKAPFGIVSLETSFALLYTEFVKRQKRWSLAQLVNWMSYAPAKRFGLEKIGLIKEGFKSDLILVDLEHEDTIDVTKFVSKGKNSPFHGWNVNAKVVQTFVDGQLVWKG